LIGVNVTMLLKYYQIYSQINNILTAHFFEYHMSDLRSAG